MSQHAVGIDFMEGRSKTNVSRRDALKKLGYGAFTATTMMTILNANAQGEWADINSGVPTIRMKAGAAASSEVPIITISGSISRKGNSRNYTVSYQIGCDKDITAVDVLLYSDTARTLEIFSSLGNTISAGGTITGTTGNVKLPEGVVYVTVNHNAGAATGVIS